MLFFVITAISCIITVLFYVTGLTHNLFIVLPIFIACFVSVLLIWLLPCVICSMFVDLKKPCVKHSSFFRFYADSIISFIRSLFGIRVIVRGTELIPLEKFLLVSNHRSQMDPILELGVFSDYRIGLIAKQELFKAPIVSKIIHKCFCLPLDRSSSRRAAATIAQAADLIRTQTASIGIYPEGTCNIKPDLLPFRSGAFKIAQKAECPIVVAVIRDSELAAKCVPFKKIKVFVDIVGVIGADEVSQCKTSQLSDCVRRMMEKALIS
ncbi:MAG: 1-acyl-sn-glycerol-3-phosphate acyltransferase [Eubacterium sp.]|nr:1-acyl-sn-glycerol-3-phosphate acyltransferase [Eubacterium sp.]